MLRRGDIRTVFTLHLISSILMAGITVVSQFITYHTYHFLSVSNLQEFQEFYIFRAFLIFGPIMVIEFITGVQLIVRIGDFQLHRLIRADMAILLSIWIITFAVELPLHLSLLEDSETSRLVQSLLFGNFIRMTLWLLKSYLVTRMIPHFYVPTVEGST